MTSDPSTTVTAYMTTLTCWTGLRTGPLLKTEPPTLYHQVIIDSAATFSAIDEGYADEHLPHIDWDLDPASQVNTISPNGKIRTKGKARLFLHFSAAAEGTLYMMPVTFYKVCITQHPILLGVPALRESEATIGLTSPCPWIHFRHGPPLRFRCFWKHGCGTPAPMMRDEDRVSPPATEPEQAKAICP